MEKLRIKLPEKVVVSLVRDDNKPYFRPFYLKFIGGDSNSGKLPNFGTLFEMCADQVRYSTSVYKKIEDIAGMETMSGDRAERYRWSKMSGFSVEGEALPVRELTYVKTTLLNYLDIDEDQTETAKAERMRESALQCAREALVQ